jgi:hypothetical protein
MSEAGIISIIETRIFKNRVINELKQMYDYEKCYEYINISLVFNPLEKDKCEINILNNKMNNIKFIIGLNYPFKSPLVYINDIIYNRTLSNRTYRINYFLKYPTEYIIEYNNRFLKNDYTCLCCKSITCESNWCAGMTTLSILKEIDDYNILKRNIKYKIFLNDIIKIYNLPCDFIKKIYEYC